MHKLPKNVNFFHKRIAGIQNHPKPLQIRFGSCLMLFHLIKPIALKKRVYLSDTAKHLNLKI